MADLVVTVPKNLWSMWIDEGDAAGEPESGEEWRCASRIRVYSPAVVRLVEREIRSRPDRWL